MYQLDSIVYQKNGELNKREVFDNAHNDILHSERWLLDGFGPITSFYQRLEAADTLIYIDLPYPVSYWLVTKRLLKSLFVKPEGWPDGSSVFKGTLESYKILRLCPKFWNNGFLQKLEDLSVNKSLYVIRTMTELNEFIDRLMK